MRSMHRRAWGTMFGTLCLLSAASGCGPADTDTGTGGDTTGTTTSTTNTGGGGAGGSTGGSTGGGGGTICTPGETQGCYEGPDGTEGVGVCKAGTRMCQANGEGFGPCMDQVLPSDETCLTPVDDDCDGQANESGEGCNCVPGTMMDCYSGPAGTEGVGLCQKGQQACKADGTGYEACAGDVVPTVETCLTAGDDDCDGVVNEDGPGCACAPGTTEPCYTGPMGTEGVGACKAGAHTCLLDGTGYGPCMNEVTPVVETCLTPVDDNCNGQINEEGMGCACSPNSTAPCYSGPAGTLGVGACKAGSATCQPDGTGYGMCVGEVKPLAETCATPVDDDCDGMTNEEGADCGCVPGTTKSCYTGPAGTVGVGTCASGLQTCQPDGQTYGPCTGEVLPAAENCATAIDEDCDLGTDCGGVVWSVGFGATGQQQGYGIATDAAGNTFLAGGFTGQLPVLGSGFPPLFSAGGSDVFLVKLDPAGVPVWYKGFGSAGLYEQASSIVTDAAGNILVTGYFDGTLDFGGGVTLTSAGNLDIFVAKLDTAGNPLWAKRFGDQTPQYGVDVALDGGGNLFLLAKGFGTTDFGGGALTSAGLFDVYVAKLDSNGAHLWSKRFGSAMDDDGVALAADPTGGVVITGSFSAAVDFGGGALSTMGGSDVFVAKYGPTGAHQWSKRYGDAANQSAVDVDVDASGNVLVNGGFEGTVNFGSGAMTAVGTLDAFVAKLDATGNGLLSKRYGAVGSEIAAYAIKAGVGGEVYVAGAITGPIDFGSGMLPAGGGADVFLLRLDSSLNVLWNGRFGAAANQYPKNLAVNAAGDAFAIGYFEGSMTLGMSTLTSAGVFDVWAARFAR